MLTYQSLIVEEKKSITQKFTQDGKEIKINLFSFANDGDESAELLLALVKDFDNMVDTLYIFNTLTVKKVIDRFRRCLSGTALEDWDLIRAGTPATTQAAFKRCKFELIEEMIEDFQAVQIRIDWGNDRRRRSRKYSHILEENQKA